MSNLLDRYALRAIREQVILSVGQLASQLVSQVLSQLGNQPVSGPVAAAQVSQTSQQRFVSDSQVAGWNAGSRIRPVILNVQGLAGSQLIAHNLDSDDIWVDVKTATNQPEFNVLAYVDMSIADPAVRKNNLRVIVPAGDPPFTGRIRCERVLEPGTTQ